MPAADPIDWILSVAESDPQRTFLETADGGIVSYGTLARLVANHAAALDDLGVTAGDRVLAQVEKSPEALYLYLACLWAGAIFVPLNTAYTDAEIDYFISDAGPALLVLDPSRVGDTALSPATRTVTLSSIGTGSLADAVAAAKKPLPRRSLAQEAAAAMLYTSGTTGKPKGAVLSRRALATNAVTLVEAWRFTKDDTLLHALPVFHAHGLFVATNTVLASGCSMIFLPKFDPDEIVRRLPRATVMMGVPTFYTRLLSQPGFDRPLTAHMRLFVSGSAPLLAETHSAFEKRTGHAILERYGMTETLMNSSNPYEGSRIAGSVGLPLPGIELRIADPESGAPVALDETGMIEVRGPNLFDGYWRNPQKTADSMRPDGFFITGDLGRIDEAGYVHIVGRANDLIISGGYNVYPKEIETEINALAGIAETAVIGIPHPDFGEAVIAVIAPEPGATIDPEAILAALNLRLARFKQPKAIKTVPELPRNSMGKVQKNLLKAEYAGLFSTSSN